MEPSTTDPDIEKASFRARVAMGSLLSAAVFTLLAAAVYLNAVARSEAGYGAYRSMGVVLQVDRVVSYATTAVLAFWVHRATRNVNRHLGGAVNFSPALAAAAFCIPLVKTFLPFVYLRTLREQSSPDAYPPVQRAVQVSPENYRDGGARVETLVPSIPKAPVEAWWAVTGASFVVAVPMYFVASVLGFQSYAVFAVLRAALTTAGAVLGAMTIYAIDRAQVERAARLAHMSRAPAASVAPVA